MKESAKGRFFENTKTGKGDIQNLVKETFSIIIKLSHFFEQFMILLMPSDPRQFMKMGIDEVNLFYLKFSLQI